MKKTMFIIHKSEIYIYTSGYATTCSTSNSYSVKQTKPKNTES